MHILASEIFLIHVEETFSLRVSIAVLRCWRMVLELYGLRPKRRKNILLSLAMRGADNPVPLGVTGEPLSKPFYNDDLHWWTHFVSSRMHSYPYAIPHIPTRFNLVFRAGIVQVENHRRRAYGKAPVAIET
jgi:hypothetical protein